MSPDEKTAKGTTEPAMKPSYLSHFRITETYWRGIILVLSVAVIVFTIWCLMHGITIIFMHLYYFPIVLLAYRYRWKGFGLATLLSLAYLGLSIAFDANQPDIILGALYRFLVFVGIAAVIAYLSDRLAKAQSTMQQSAELRDRYLSLAPAIVLALDRNGAITYLSKHGSEILECIPDDAVGKLWVDQFLPEKDRLRVKEVFSQLMAGQVEQNRIVENLVMTCGGAEKIIRWYNTVLYDKDGAISGILGFGQDITEEKWAQDTLKEMQQFQESVITNANVWISVLEPDGTLLVWNDAAEAISGYKKTGVLGKRTVWKQLYPDNEYRKKVTGDIQRIIGRDTYLENFETEIRCADGAKKTIVWNTRGQRDTKGIITSYIAIGRDITKQAEAEAEIRHLATFPRFTPVNILESDMSGKILYINPAMENTIAAIGISDPEIFIPRDFLKKSGTESPGTTPFLSERELVIQNRTFTLNLSFVPESRSVRVYATDITDRRQAEAAIAESEQKFRTVFDSSPDGLLLADAETHRFVMANSAIMKQTGYTEAELFRLSIIDIVPPSDRLAAIEQFKKVAHGDATLSSNQPIQRKDGTVYFTDIGSASITLHGRPYMIGIFHDITERKAAEEAIQRSGQEWQTTFDAINDVVYLLDDKSRIVRHNRAFETFTGKSAEEIYGRYCFEIMHGTGHPINGCPYVKAQLSRHRESIELNIDNRWFVASVDPIIDKNGKITGAVHLMTDITERKAAEVVMQENEEKYRVLFTQMTEGGALHDMVYDESQNPVDYRIIDVNPAFERILGLKREDVIGKTGREVYGVDAPPFLDIYARVASTGQPETSEVYFAPMKKHFAISIYSPGVGRFATIFADITERKAAEEEIRFSNVILKTQQETSPDGILIVDKSGKILSFNQKFTEIWGIPKEIIDSRDDEQALSFVLDKLADPKEFLSRVRYLYEHPQEKSREEILLKDGKVFDRYSAPMLGEDNRYFGRVWYFHNITERKRAEKEQWESEIRFTELFETVSSGVAIYEVRNDGLSGKDYIIKNFNKTALALEGKKKEEVVGRSLYDMRPSIDDYGLIPIFREVWKTGNPAYYPATVYVDEKYSNYYENRVFRLPGGEIVAIYNDVTEQKRAEAALMESKTLTDAVVENVPLMIFLKEARDLRFVIFNRAGEELLGYDRQALLGKNNLDLFPPEQAAQFMEKDREVLDGDAGMLDIPEEPIMTAKKGLRLLHTRKVCIRGSDGTTKFLLGISEDITERKAAEEALRSSEEQFRVIFHNQQTGLIMVDAVTHMIADANVAALSMIGASRDEVVGKICHTFICPAEMGKCPVSDLGHTVDNSERVLIRANGETIPILKSVNPVTIGGRPFLIESFVDLTERKRMEKQISESRQLFADIISFLPDPTFVIDKEGKVLAWNRALEQLSGVSAGDIIGKGDHEYSLWLYEKRHPILIDLVLHPDQDVGQRDYSGIHWEGHTVTAQTEIIRPGSGHMTSLLLVASPLIDAQGNITGAIESMRDISRLKEAEAELERINQNLEQIVRDRTLLLEDEVAQRMRAEKDVQSALTYTRSVIEANPDLMVVLDRNGTVLDINATAELLTGIPREQLIGTLYFSYLVDDGTLYNAFSRLLKEGRIENLVTVRHTDGHTTPLSINATLIGKNDAPDARIIVAAHDITRQKQDEEAIRSSQQMLTNVLENFPGLVFWKDKNSVYLGCNKNFSDGAGLKDPVQIIGKTDFDLPWANTEAESYRSFDREVMDEGKARLNIIETQFQSDGRIIWLDTSKIPIFGLDGTVIGIIGTSHDITRQKKDEDAIKASLDEKVILLREVHHRVKNNLQIIISLVNLQMRQTDDPVVKRIMSETQNRVRAMSLVHEKLYRSESLAQIDFADYTRYLATQLFSFYGSDTKRVRLDFAMGKIMVDINTAVPLGLLMNEIISNALKHAFPNGREGTISISGSDENNVITLVVRDDGIGIAADFDWKNTTSLGMRLVTSLIDQVDGTITLDRSAGTAFSIVLKKKD